jgi:hypothetical protein
MRRRGGKGGKRNREFHTCGRIEFYSNVVENREVLGGGKKAFDLK